jgi:hypothetical protein
LKMHFRRFRLVHSILLLAALPASGVAAPPVFSEAAQGFQVELGLPGASTCVLFPKELRDPTSCEGIDLQHADSSRRHPAARAGAVLRYPDWNAMLAVMQLPGTSSDLDEEFMAQMVAANRSRAEKNGEESRPHGVEPGADFDMRLISGRKAYRYISIKQEGASNGWSHSLNYVVASGDRLYAVAISTAPENLSAVVASADALERGITTAPPHALPSKASLTLGEELEAWTAKRWRLGLALIGAFLSLGILVVLGYRAKRRVGPVR